ncbi:hypothetical protein NXS19_013873 [Fusarium pseudograminearum]|nr:hypothetical protein NXS19_013873 [Fusarium pseudograminearum]
MTSMEPKKCQCYILVLQMPGEDADKSLIELAERTARVHPQFRGLQQCGYYNIAKGNTRDLGTCCRLRFDTRSWTAAHNLDECSSKRQGRVPGTSRRNTCEDLFCDQGSGCYCRAYKRQPR